MHHLIRAVATALVIGSLGLAATPASATPTRFYDMGAIKIRGDIAKPAVLYVTKREKLKWERLLSLKKSLKQALIRSGSSPLLK